MNLNAFTAEGLPSLCIGQPETAEEVLIQRNEMILAHGTKPRAWSHTALDNFCTCPHQYHEVKVLKRWADEPGEAAIWGNRVHEAFEKYLKKEAELPTDLTMYKGYLDAIAAGSGEMEVEKEMCLNNRLEPCGPFGEHVFVRGYADVLHIDGDRARIMDHKTGKRKPNSRQMKLMALLCFHHYAQVMKIRVGFFWLKVFAKDTEEFTRAQIPELWNEFLPDLMQFKRAFETDTWQKRASGLCYGWCPVTGCEFWRPKKVRR